MDPKIVLIFLALVTLSTTTMAYDEVRCDAPPSVPGRCRALFRKWVFKGKICQRLLYGGCDATANLFESREECVAACKKPKNVKPKVINQNKNVT
ncbi:kunitz-type serine protease inhibitor HNTX-03141017-like [Drosophila elegans]|uniref:kunitz-type serine protease inhibitor HNTX-03141017-like n=1 Tax=Drosophila elegans TaxID=30023 RepID=UPI0007E605E7|nr:kunitz-type serine protease inhibitor HNTX-03141017-like [Drosophila elegans]